MSGDPMLDGITRYSVRNDYLTSRAAVGGEPFKGSTDAVLFSDLPALIEKVREDERARWSPPAPVTPGHVSWCYCGPCSVEPVIDKGVQGHVGGLCWCDRCQMAEQPTEGQG